jgi:hypothetical protein
MKFKERHLLQEGFGYDHKNPGQQYFMNTFNGLAGGTVGLAGLAGLHSLNPELFSSLTPNEKIALTAGTVIPSAIAGSHYLGKLDKEAFKAMDLDKKEDFKS